MKIIGWFTLICMKNCMKHVIDRFHWIRLGNTTETNSWSEKQQLQQVSKIPFKFKDNGHGSNKFCTDSATIGKCELWNMKYVLFCSGLFYNCPDCPEWIVLHSLLRASPNSFQFLEVVEVGTVNVALVYQIESLLGMTKWSISGVQEVPQVSSNLLLELKFKAYNLICFK